MKGEKINFRTGIRLMALILVLAMLGMLMVGCGGDGSASTTAKGDLSGSKASDVSAAPDKPASWISDEPLTFSMIIADEAFAPFNPDWQVLTEAAKRTNVKLDIQVVPGADYRDKVSLLINTQDLPDIVTGQYTGDQAEHCMNGSFVAISDYMDQLPHFKALIEKWGFQNEIQSKSLSDGKFYWLPGVQEAPVYYQGLIVRDDLMKKHGLSDPKTMDELYNVLKALKQEYPDSLPLTCTYGSGCLLCFMCESYGIQAGWSSDGTMSYDFENKKYFATWMDQKGKEFISYLSKLAREGLLDPEFTTQTSDQFNQKFVTGKSFVTFFYYSRFPGLEKDASENLGTDVQFRLLPPPAGPDGIALSNLENAKLVRPGWMIPAEAKGKPYFDKLLKFADWWGYSDEGVTLTTWGIENETYKEVNGKKEFTSVVKGNESITKILQVSIGAVSNSWTLTMPFDFSVAVMNDPEIEELAKYVLDNNMIRPSVPMLKYTEEEREKRGIMAPPIEDYTNSMLEQFILGQKSVENDYDTFLTELKNKGLEEFEKFYNTILARDLK